MRRSEADARAEERRRGVTTRAAVWLACLSAVSSCAPEGLAPGDEPEGAAAEVVGEDERVDGVVVDTSNGEARAQYDANVAFARSYRARCTPSRSSRPRVLLTGFGRFLDNPTNATGMLVSTLVPAAVYPNTTRPPSGMVDAPEPQTSVARRTLSIEGVGDVDVCAMVLPVYWDLAAVLVIKELQSFSPELVVMNGIAGERQELWLELGAVNRAMPLVDGSNVLAPLVPEGARYATLVPEGERERGLRLSWGAVQRAVHDEVRAQGAVLQSGVRFDELALGALRGGFPRGSNTYLCNNLAYTVSYAMNHPSQSFTLLQASRALAGRTNRVTVKLTRDLRRAARVFVHWPSALEGAHLSAGAAVLRALVGAQLRATRSGDAATEGTNAQAEIAPSGDWF